MSTLKDKALKVIEILSSDDFCESLEFKIGVHNDCKLSEEDVRLVENKLGKIYRISHVANKPSCIKSHDGWVAELEKTYADFVERGDIKDDDEVLKSQSVSETDSVKLAAESQKKAIEDEKELKEKYKATTKIKFGVDVNDRENFT